NRISTRRSPLASFIAEGTVEFHREWVCCGLVFWVPLHTQGKNRLILGAHRFDRAVRCVTLCDQTRSEPVDALAMQRVDPDLALSGNALENPAGDEADRVARAIAMIQSLNLRRTVIVTAVYSL